MDPTQNNELSVLSFPVFTGKKTEFVSWLNTVRENSIAVEEIVGVLSSWLFTPAEWQYLAHAGYRPGLNAGDPDVLAEPFQDFEAPNGQVVPNNLNAYQYNIMLNKRAQFRIALAKSLSKSVKHTICPDGEFIYSLHPRIIFQRLRQHYGRLEAQDLHDLRQSLNEPYNQEKEIETFYPSTVMFITH